MDINRKSFLVGLGATLAGCAQSPSLSLLDTASTVKGCCDRLSDAAFVRYTGRDIVRLRITDSSQSFRFSSGESRFAALKFDKPGEYGLLEVTTSKDGFIVPLSKVYVPTFLFLDDSFRELGSAEPVLFQSTGKHDDTRRSTYYGARFIPAECRYVVIHTDASKLSTVRVRFQQGWGLGGDLALSRIQDVFKPIDKRLYAAGRVRPFDGGSSFNSYELDRQATGEVRLSLTPMSELGPGISA